MRYAVFFTLFVSTTSVAHASVISIPCTENVYSGQSNSGQSSACGAFAAPVGTEITALSYRFSIDFQFNEQNGGSVSLTAALNGNGAADVSGVMLNPLNRPVVGNVIVAPADWAAFLSGGSIATSYVGASSAVTGATFSATVNFTYEIIPIQGDVPESSTLLLTGGTLIFAMLVKRRAEFLVP